ncbi:hypothetical protein LT85_3724 [Collimonas arenae]|uniref:Uncharacterized protein n=1 Tax=Collimonas arenae TaxID=279058 RepID=A0A0A1FJ27_9BURK|nr:hypothetical protein LT85_3724 [Collimonas arenae]
MGGRRFNWSKFDTPFQKLLLKFDSKKFAPAIGLNPLNGKWHLLYDGIKEIHRIVCGSA